MNTSTDVPVTIAPEAEARLTELGMHKELEQIIAHIREVVPELTAIEVAIAERYDTGGEPGVSIIAYSDRPYHAEDKTSWNLIRWDVETFPPQVLEHLCTLLLYGRPDAG
jgi:hypothetical protein